MAAALAVLFVAFRLLFLTADPPAVLPNGYVAHELFVEPAAKSHEARNFALFGAWQTSPADNYQFWRAQSPVWVYSLAWFYRAFGVGYAELRVFATLTSVIGLFALLALAARRLHGAGFLAAGLFFSIDYAAIHYGRVGLLEPAVNSLVVMAMLCLALSRRDVLWLFPAQWALVLAFLTKQTAAFVLPVALAFGAASLVRCARGGSRKRLIQGALILHALALGAALVAHASTDAYLRTVAWNYGHAVNGADGATTIDTTSLSAQGLLARLFEGVKYWRYISVFPIAGTLAFLEAVRLGVRVARRKHVGAWSSLVLAWCASACLTLLVTELDDVRFYLILFPPVALLAGSAIQSALRMRLVRRYRFGRALVWTATIGSFVVTNLIFYVLWVGERTYDVVTAGRIVEETLGAKKAVVVGLWAAPLVLETPYVHYYVKKGFNTQKEALDELGVTHLLVLDQGDYARSILRKNYPDRMDTLQLLAELDVRRKHMSLYALDPPLGQATPERRLGPLPVPPALRAPAPIASP